MAYSDETLSAFLDGELPENEAAELRRALEREPALKARLETLGLADEAVRRTYAEIDATPTPASVLRLLGVEEDSPSAARSASVVSMKARAVPRRVPAWSLPLAASVALLGGLGLGTGLFAPTAAVQVAGVIDHANPLYAALEEGPSAVAAKIDGAQVTPLLTFRSVGGAYCREFLSQDKTSGLRAVACRENSVWRVKIAVADAPIGPAGVYATAGGADGALDEYVDGVIDGDPLDPKAESQLLKNDWTP